MKKAWWILPAAMFVLSLVGVMYLNSRDIDPASCVFDGLPTTALSEAEVISLWENNLDLLEKGELPEGMSRAENGMIAVSKGADYAQYLADFALEGYSDRGGEGYNLACNVRRLSEKWSYVLIWNKHITFEKEYISRLEKQFEEVSDPVFTLLDKDLAPYPAEKSKSDFAVVAEFTCRGERIKACLDPKTKLYIGKCQ